MNRTLRGIAATALVAVVPALAGAQSMMMLIDGGKRSNKYANGPSIEADQVGMALSMVVGGSSSAQTALLMPMSADFRYVSLEGQGFEVNADVDGMVRLGPFAAGVGIALRMPAAHSYSWNCSDYEDCPASGFSDEDSDEAVMFGPSYSAKLNFGPQGRFFVQGKVADLAMHMDQRGGGETCNEFGCFATYAPEFNGGRETRIGTGFAWKGKVFRAQWVQQTAEYERTQRNSAGDMDRESSGWTVGMGWYF